MDQQQPYGGWVSPKRPIETRNLNPGIHTSVEIPPGDGRTCCDYAWHCDQGYWNSLRGKGFAWLPFLLILYVLLFAITLLYAVLGLFGLCVVATIVSAGKKNGENDQERDKKLWEQWCGCVPDLKRQLCAYMC